LLNRYDECVAVGTDQELRRDPTRRQLRRETVALLAEKHEQFADPLDLLKGMHRSNVGPAILRGTGHGDIHGRNIQVSLSGDEVTHCAVFDYEKFHKENFLAWDFIKLECETAVRLLDRLGDPDHRGQFTQQCLTFWRHVAQRTAAFDRGAKVSVSQTESLPGPEWTRLANGIVQLRRLAYEHLGQNRGRIDDWLDEYELLTAWYGCRAGLYDNYAPRWTVAALVGAGVAARRLMRRLPADVELSHRRRFVAASQLARSDDTDQRTQSEQLLADLSRDYPHILEIQEERTLVLIRLGEFEKAEQLLNSVAEKYDMTSAETPARWGSLWKRRAYASKSVDQYALEQSLKWYQRATEYEPANFYPRINVATLLLILGRPLDSQKQAAITLEQLNASKAQDHWWLATTAEATVLKGDDIATALEWYRRAVANRDCQPADRNTMRRQLELLRSHLPERTREQLTDATLNDVFIITPQEST